MKKSFISFDSCYIQGSASTVGRKEYEGPLSQWFDAYEEDEYFGCDSFECAESEMARRNINLLLSKTGLSEKDISLVIGGDLLNQCTATSFALAGSGIPFLGLYGACTTIAEALICGGVFVDSQKSENSLCIASSHFCAAERQYRFPLEYGSTRTPTSQNTVTAAGAFLLAKEKSPIRLLEAEVGCIVDKGVTDANNMGAAMAGAAVDTIKRFFAESSFVPSDFDIIATGDLGKEGYELACELLDREKLDLCGKYTDCGMLIYDNERQDTHSGGSGCGCLASVLGGYFLKRMEKGELNRILAIGTGALLNTSSVLQKRSIPAVAHAVHICKGD